MSGSLAWQIANAPDRAGRLRRVADWRGLLTAWPFWADPRQLPPEGDWLVWLMMAGRGFGKTRTGAEWVRGVAEADGAARIALVGATRDEVRNVMVEGPSGVLAVSPVATRPRWEPTRGRLVWRTGAEAMVFSGENPDSLRGPQHSHAWCDEIAKWAYPKATWDNLRLGLRMSEAPRALVTTTPRPIALLRTLAKAKGTKLVTGRTHDNRHLPGAFLAAMDHVYGGTRLGRQELDGELIGEAAGALWTRDMLEGCRVPPADGGWSRVVIGVDPPAGSLRGTGDACGIVVVARDGKGVAHVIADESVATGSPEAWARAVASAAVRHAADRVVAEANNGGLMVESVLRAADYALPLTLVHASHGKSARAEPVAALYEAGRVRHVGAFPELEDELCGLVAGGGYEGPGRSPDRADALVWALTELMLGKKRGMAGVRVLG